MSRKPLWSYKFKARFQIMRLVFYIAKDREVTRLKGHRKGRTSFIMYVCFINFFA